MPPERAVIENHLAKTEQAVTLGHAHVEHQIEIIAGLEKDGHDTAQARDLLRTFRDTVAEQEALRDQLLAGLREVDRPRSG